MKIAAEGKETTGKKKMSMKRQY